MAGRQLHVIIPTADRPYPAWADLAKPPKSCTMLALYIILFTEHPS